VTAQRVGHETVQYVANIYKYYVSYALLERHLRTGEQVKGLRPEAPSRRSERLCYARTDPNAGRLRGSLRRAG